MNASDKPWHGPTLDDLVRSFEERMATAARYDEDQRTPPHLLEGYRDWLRRTDPNGTMDESWMETLCGDNEIDD